MHGSRPKRPTRRARGIRAYGSTLIEVLFALTVAASAAATTLHLQLNGYSYLNRSFLELAAARHHLSFSGPDLQACVAKEAQGLRYLTCEKSGWFPLRRKEPFLILLN